MKFLKPSGALLAVTLLLGLISNRANAASFDQQFIDSMMPHHQSAVMMAQMAVAKAHYPEVRRLARGIIRDQNKEIAQMGAWRKAWFGGAGMPMDHGSMPMTGGKMQMMSGAMMGLPMKMMMDMGKLQRVHGAEFDRMFLRMMIPHHASAIDMADEALNTTSRPELRRLAANIIDTQAAEIGQMHAIYDRHFGHIRR